MSWIPKTRDIGSGFVTALFSIPEGMAYAKLAGVDPVYGLYSGIVPTIAAALSTGTVLMISTITSAIAISTHSSFDVAGISHDQKTSALFTLTFLIGAVMLIMGIFRLGKVVNFVSNSVMTGFVVGASFLILVGELGELVGIDIPRTNKFHEILHWITHIDQWNLTTSAVGFGSIVLMVLFRSMSWLKEAAPILVLITGTLVVYFLGLTDVPLVRSIAKVPEAFPPLVLPDPTLMPKLALGAISVALVAMIQGAGVSSAIPNPSGKSIEPSRDFIGQGIGNLAGSFFSSLGTGGSLSRTALSVSAGATSRFGGIFAGVSLLMIILAVGHLIEFVPLATIAGILCVIAVQLIASRLPDIRLIASSSRESFFVMVITFVSALFIHLQWTIFLGAGLSLAFYLYTSTVQVKISQLIKDNRGFYEEHPPPEVIPSNKVTILNFEGNGFFAEVPVIKSLMPSTKGTKGATLIWRVRGLEDVHSTFLKWFEGFTQEFQQKGNRLVLEGVEPEALDAINRTEIINLIGKNNVFPAEPGIWMALDKALKSTKK